MGLEPKVKTTKSKFYHPPLPDYLFSEIPVFTWSHETGKQDTRGVNNPVYWKSPDVFGEKSRNRLVFRHQTRIPGQPDPKPVTKRDQKLYTHLPCLSTTQVRLRKLQEHTEPRRRHEEGGGTLVIRGVPSTRKSVRRSWSPVYPDSCWFGSTRSSPKLHRTCTLFTNIKIWSF